MKFKRLTVCCGVVVVLLTGFSPLSFGAKEPTRTDPAEYQEHEIRSNLRKDHTSEEAQEPVRVPEEVRKLQFDQPREQEYDEMIHTLSFTGEDKVTTEMIASHIGLFDTENPLPQQTPNTDDSSVAWLPWALGGVVIALFLTLFVYILPKGFNQMEQ
ncbi:YueC family protein [Siminovitchia terrae]|uniref:YueC family protein n=1 Tax=Siminovitchia terrae TaxID=1914933 RepID=UPI0028A6F159|nr:YueC family protein [Siminovitchia terrae]